MVLSPWSSHHGLAIERASWQEGLCPKRGTCAKSDIGLVVEALAVLLRAETYRLEHQSAAETLDACADLSKGMVTEITVPDGLDSTSS